MNQNKQRPRVRKDTIKYQADNLDQLVSWANQIYKNNEDASVEVNFPCFVVGELTTDDAIVGRGRIFISSQGLILKQIVFETYHWKYDKNGDYVDNLNRPMYSIDEEVIFPAKTVRVDVSLVDDLPLPLSITAFDKVPEEIRSFRGKGCSISRDNYALGGAPSETVNVAGITSELGLVHPYGKTLTWPIVGFSFAKYDPTISDYLAKCMEGLDKIRQATNYARDLLKTD
ncbi:MAG: hypothetical protein AABW48_00640 [Nanoarchaeota archaeon]